jgi:hypothetical protein
LPNRRRERTFPEIKEIIVESRDVREKEKRGTKAPKKKKEL